MRKIPGGRKLTRSRLKKKRAKFLNANRSQHTTDLLGFLTSGFDTGKGMAKSFFGDRSITDEMVRTVLDTEYGMTDTSIPELRLALLHNFTTKNGFKEQVLRMRRDTTFSMKEFEYRTILEENGFVKVLEEDFVDDTWKDEKPSYEKCFVYFREPGQVLFFDTFHGGRNGGNVYFNWKPKAGLGYRSMPSYNGHTTQDGVSIGHMDCREGLIYKLNTLSENGEFLGEWVEGGHIWFVNFVEAKKADGISYPRSGIYYDSISLNRIKRLPGHVQKCMAKQIEHLEEQITRTKARLQPELYGETRV